MQPVDDFSLGKLVVKNGYKQSYGFRFKMWLAQVGRERIEETIDPELTIEIFCKAMTC